MSTGPKGGRLPGPPCLSNPGKVGGLRLPQKPNVSLWVEVPSGQLMEFNPLFKGAKFKWNKVLMKSAIKVPSLTFSNAPWFS